MCKFFEFLLSIGFENLSKSFQVPNQKVGLSDWKEMKKKQNFTMHAILLAI